LAKRRRLNMKVVVKRECIYYGCLVEEHPVEGAPYAGYVHAPSDQDIEYMGTIYVPRGERSENLIGFCEGDLEDLSVS